MASSSAALHFTVWNSLSLNLGQGVFEALPIFACWAGGSQPYPIIWLSYVCWGSEVGSHSKHLISRVNSLAVGQVFLLLLLLFLVSVLQLCHLLSVEQASRTTVPRTLDAPRGYLLFCLRSSPPFLCTSSQGCLALPRESKGFCFVFLSFFCKVSEFSSAKSSVDFIEVPSASNTSEPGTVKQCKQL